MFDGAFEESAANEMSMPEAGDLIVLPDIAGQREIV